MEIKKNVLKRMNDAGTKGIKAMADSMHKLEEEHITLAANQIEFEKYLKDILTRLDGIQKKLGITDNVKTLD